MATNEFDVYLNTIKKIGSPTDLNKVLSALPADSKLGPLILQGMGLVGKQNIVNKYAEEFENFD